MTVYASMHILATKPLDKAAGKTSSLVPQEQAAMNRPQRFRGLATDPGVQRKAPEAVIRRAGTAVGKTIWMDPYRASRAERSSALLKSLGNRAFWNASVVRHFKLVRRFPCAHLWRLRRCSDKNVYRRSQKIHSFKGKKTNEKIKIIKLKWINIKKKKKIIFKKWVIR